MKKDIIPLAIAVIYSFLYNSVQAQEISGDKLEALRSMYNVFYVDKNGDQFGCGRNLECFPFKVKIYSMAFDNKSDKLVMYGSVFFDGVSKDTVTVGGVSILIANPIRDTLTEVRLVGSTIETKDHISYPYRRGDFKVEFVAKENDKLYFSHPIYFLVEYDIGKLIQELFLHRK